MDFYLSNHQFQIIFLILRSTSVLNESSTLTWADVNIGLPTLIISLLMVPFSLFFHYAYSIKPYRLSRIAWDQVENGKNEPFAPQQYQGGLFNLRMWFSVSFLLILSVGFEVASLNLLLLRNPSVGKAKNYATTKICFYARD